MTTSEDYARREAHTSEPVHRPWVMLTLVAAFAVVLVLALVGLPREGAKLPAIARYALAVALPSWHITEPVNEIVYGTRGFDTFGETFLLLAAVVSVVVLSRSREARQGFIGEEVAGEREQAQTDPAAGADATEEQARAAEEPEAEEYEESGEHERARPATPDETPVGTPAPERAEAMTVVVRTAGRMASPILAVAGCYLVAWGYSPGGGFPAGAVLLGVILLLYAGFGYRRIARVVRPALLEAAEMAGAGVIIFTELLGLILKGSFSANWLPPGQPQTIHSGGILQVFSGGELIEVATGLTLAIFGLIGLRHDWTPDQSGHQAGPGEHAQQGDTRSPAASE